MFRRLRVLAAFAMIPVVLFVNPTMANASASGPWQQIHVSMDVLGSNDWVARQCTFNARNTGTSVEVGAGGICTGLPDSSPGGLQPGEAGSSFALTFDGADEASASCGATYGGILGQTPSNGTLRVAGALPPGLATITGGSSPGTCVITEVCLRLMDTEFVCTSATLEPPPLAPDPGDETCPLGVPSVVFFIKTFPNASFPDTHSDDRLYARVAITGGGSVGPITGAWAVARLKDGWTPYQVRVGQVGGDFDMGREWSRSNAEPKTLVPSGLSAEAYAYGFPGTINNDFQDPYAAQRAVQTPTGTRRDQPYHGVTDWGDCRYYFGDKAYNDPGSDSDEPAGDGVSDIPVEEPPPVIDTPVVDEPSNWLAAIWAVLQSIWSAISGGFSALATAIGSLASAIVNGIGNMLTSLFIPSDGFLAGKWTGVENKWSNTSPGKYLDAVTGLAPGSVSGCSGLPLLVTLPGGVQVDQHIGAACTGSMASAAGMTRAALSVVFLVGGTIACLRAVGSGLGWNPGIGRGVDS